MVIENYKEKLTKGFCFFGPIGNLIPVLPIVHSFRFFYIIAFLGALCFTFQFNRMKENRYLFALSVPLIIYTFISALVGLLGNTSADPAENLLIRWTLMMVMFFFVLYASSGHHTAENCRRYIKLYLYGYLVSMIAGYIIFAGYYEGIIPFDVLQYIEVLPQLGYGMLRFSPGSYPNEYGIVSSFALSVITYLLLSKNNSFSKKTLVIMYLFTFVALVLTTTRAAYIAYGLCLLFLLFRQAMSFHLKRIVFLIFVVVSLIALALYVIQTNYYDILAVFEVGYDSFTSNTGSSAERFEAWDIASKSFLDENYITGLGFGSLGNMHNVYLELFFELGLLGTGLLLATFMLYSIAFKAVLRDEFFSVITTLGMINVFWFAVSNHNLNHHLTWFVVLLFLLQRKMKTIKGVIK